MKMWTTIRQCREVGTSADVSDAIFPIVSGLMLKLEVQGGSATRGMTVPPSRFCVDVQTEGHK